ncbi:MAG: hypothetical protein PHD37_00950 [Gallionellaceae bacterium]|nr:hypothetical protein [Gallionellaceae bacterium]
MPFTPLESSKRQVQGFVPLEPDQPENGAVKTLRAIGQVYPVAETAANLVTQAVALPVAGVASLGAMATNALGITDADPAAVVHDVAGALTYQPHTDLGQHLTGAAMYPFAKLQEAGRAAGNATLDLTGSPVAATAVDTAIQASPMAVAPAAKAIKGRVKKPVPVEEGTKAPPDVVEGVPGYDVTFIPDQHMEVVNAKTANPVQAGAQRLAGDETPLPGTTVQGFSPVRRGGDLDQPAVAGLQPLPGGPGAGADASALAGAPGRTGQLRTGELPLDDATRAGTPPGVLPASGLARADRDGGGSGAIARPADAELSAAPAGERLALGESAGREVVPGIALADAPGRDPAAAGMGTADRLAEQRPMGADQARLVDGEGIDAGTIQPLGRLFGRRADTYTDAELSRFATEYESRTIRADIAAEQVRRSAVVLREDFRATADELAGTKGARFEHLAETPESLELAQFLADNADRSERIAELGQRIQEEVHREQTTPSTRTAVPGDQFAIGEGKRQSGPAPRHQEGDQGHEAAKLNMAPGINYVPFINDASLPASKAATVADLPTPMRREHIITSFAKAIGAHVYEGRIKGGKILGFFRPRNEEVRIKRANDIETTSHELAHMIDRRVPAISNAWRTDKALRTALESVSYNRSSVKEGFAEGVRLWMTQPDALETKAPMVKVWLDGFVGSNKEYGPAMKQAQADMVAWFNQDALQRARSKIGSDTPWSEALDGVWDKFRQATVDDLHGVYRMERELTGGIGPRGPYESARLSRASASIADGAVRYGAPRVKPDGSFEFTGKGLEQALAPVAERLDDALLYFVGKSANELMQQGREHLFTQAEVDAMLKLKTPEREQAFRDYQDWNKGVLDFAEYHGVLNPATRKLWQRAQYLPFQRVGQPGAYKAKPGDWSGIKALTGGTENIREVLPNMIGNAAQLIDLAVKNDARNRIAALAENRKGGRFMVKIPAESRPVTISKDAIIDGILKAMGLSRRDPRAQAIIADLEKMPGVLEMMQGNQPPAGGNVVAVLRGGRKEWYEVGDPILYRALASIDRPYQHWLINWLGLPKRVGQASITLTPDFWVANIARDTIMGSVMSRAGFRIGLDSLNGMRLRMTGDPVYKDYIANGGGLSSIYLDERQLRSKLEKFYGRQGIDYRTVLDTPEKLLGFVETLGDAFEMSTRLGEYKRALVRGEHPRHAAYLGREVSTDFAMRGDSPSLGVAYDTVMFLKPAVLSWDRLARGLAHDTNRGAIAIKAGMIALASAALYLQNRGNPRYDDLEDWKKDTYWHFFIGERHFMWPKIWEVGALASGAERMVEKTINEDPEGLGKDFARILAHTFSVNVLPQIAAPVAEQVANKSFFTGAPIETQGMEDVHPWMRTKPGTSETMRALGEATSGMPEAVQVSPARAEALLRGYLNTWAQYGLMLSDLAFFQNQAPEKRLDELPVIRRFYAQDPAKHTRYEAQFYDLLGEAVRMRGTIKALDEQGRREEADKLMENPMAGEAGYLEKTARVAGQISKEMAAVRRNHGFTPLEKREQLDALTGERNVLLKQAVQDARQTKGAPTK